MESTRATDHPIVFFDGVCGLCNGFVDRLMRWDRHHVLRFATLQGTTAKEMLPASYGEDMRSIVYLENGRLLTRSTAAIKILLRLGGAWKLAGVFLIAPRFLRDPVYDLIARNRYRWFGKREMCRLPSPEERSLFLP